MRIVHILCSLSTEEGVFAFKLYQAAEESGHKVLLCYSEGHPKGRTICYRIGTRAKTGHRKRLRLIADRAFIFLSKEKHLFMARLTDRAGLYSRRATQKLIEHLEAFQPELIHLHKLHGFYLHLPLLFEYLQKKQIPVLWSMRDCWAWTGHCIWYTDAELAPLPDVDYQRKRRSTKLGCKRWISGCGQCVLRKSYPCSLFFDKSSLNWQDKRRLFTHLQNFVITVPSEWMKQELSQSFLSEIPVYVFPEPLDNDIFQPPRDWRQAEEILRYYRISLIHEKPLLISSANLWNRHSGLDDMVELADRLGDTAVIGMIGLDNFQSTSPLPSNMIAIPTPHSKKDFAAILTAANLFVNPSHGEASPLSLAIAMSCGTRVLCYDVAAFSDFIPDKCGESVPLMDIDALAEAARRLMVLPKDISLCRDKAPVISEKQVLDAIIQLYENMYHFATMEKADALGKR